MIQAIVLYPFTLDREYRPGDTFTQPDGYPDMRVVELWLMGWVGDFDHGLLPDDLQELLSFPEWVEMNRRRLNCPGCV